MCVYIYIDCVCVYIYIIASMFMGTQQHPCFPNKVPTYFLHWVAYYVVKLHLYIIHADILTCTHMYTSMHICTMYT